MKTILLLAILSGHLYAVERTADPAAGISGVAITPSSVSASGCLQTNASGSVFKANCGTTQDVRLGGAGGLSIVGQFIADGSATVKGAFQAAGTTFTVANSGIISAPSQPRAKVATQSGTASAAGWHPIFWTTETTDPAGMFNAVSSSQTITVPAGGGGWYHAACNVEVPLEAVGGVSNYLKIVSDGSSCSALLSQQVRKDSTANAATQMGVTFDGEVAAGATFTCCYYNGTAQALDANAYNTNFSAVKLW